MKHATEWINDYQFRINVENRAHAALLAGYLQRTRHGCVVGIQQYDMVSCTSLFTESGTHDYLATLLQQSLAYLEGLEEGARDHHIGAESEGGLATGLKRYGWLVEDASVTFYSEGERHYVALDELTINGRRVYLVEPSDLALEDGGPIDEYDCDMIQNDEMFKSERRAKHDSQC